ncbi:MAG: class I SAM-dependent methyltransferase, partial [Eubacterium sp.]|nr:class I SAM-dependent methyltransferase [Eubacterium sp.]
IKYGFRKEKMIKMDEQQRVFGRSGGGEEKKYKIRVLDLGCGDGMNAIHFKEYFANMEYFGIDVSEASIAQAKELECTNVHFSCYDGKKIPFQDESFHIILIACVLHHIPHEEHKQLLLECKRVLKNNGSLYIFEHNPWNPVTRKIVNDCVFDEDADLVYRRKLVKAMQHAGFHNVKTAYIIFLPRKGLFHKFARVERWLKWCPFGGQYYLKCRK